jgi:hypothetical protein
MHDMAEHTSTLLSLIGALVSVVGVMIWKKLNTIESKMELYSSLHYQCREELPQKFIGKDEFREHKHDFKTWQEGRREIWEALNGHSHDENGKVIR